MKEFYKFIVSRDIREYLTEINYEMSAAECAFVVSDSMLSIADKHEAYQKIIDTMEDIQLPEGCGSLHEVLRARIKLEDILLDVFEQEDKAVYVYSYLDRTGGREVYSDWRRCLDEAFYWCEDEAFARVEKRWISVGDEPQKCVSVLFNADREVVNISSWGILSDELSERFWQIEATGADANIPMPFKRGDILNSETDGIFVYENEWKRPMMGGYKTNELGEVGLYTVIRPLDAEYYVGKIARKDKLLKAISLYLKGKIDLVSLIERCKE